MSNTETNIPSLGERFIDYRQPIWGNSFTWSWERPLSQIQHLVIHHTVTSHDATPDDIALLHKARGWGGIGYHFVVTEDGRVWYVGDLGTARANVLNMNEKVLGIALTGDFTKHLPSDEQITSTHLLCTGLIELISQLKNWDVVVGHKDLQATACPGTSWNGEPGGMKDRIEKNIPYTPPEPRKEVYRVVFEDNTLAEYDTNPIDLLAQLNDKLAACKDSNAKMVIKNADLEHELNELREDNRVLNGNLSSVRGQRDTALNTIGKLEKEIENLLEEKEDLTNKLTAKDPLKPYRGKGWELIKIGIKEIFSRN